MSVLEPAAREFARAAAQGPPPHQLGPVAARGVLEDIQAGATAKPDVDSAWVTVSTADIDVRARIVRPWDSTTELLPVVLYLHGGGWVLGSATTHDRLVRELAVGLHAALVFVEDDHSPEVRYPVALHQAHAVARWVQVFVHQSLYYPVTDAAQDTDSDREFAQGPHLTADSMAWFWDAYLPEPAARRQATASPPRASLDELTGLPEAFILVDECDVLRQEGEAYAAKLTQAGVPCSNVRHNGNLHDFMMLDPVRETGSATTAIAQAIDVLRRALHPAPIFAGHAREGR